ncbi:MAG TPA: PaaI family thioesterase [Candidatus Acidoferrum sp.]|nr:PaaI family thioesterase [Candidatus Acidoferrum sp.]
MSGDLRFTQMLGFELDREAPDGPTICVNVTALHKNGNGVVHGSVIHALLDTVMGMQCFRAAGRQPVATAEISVRFLRPVVDGRLEARARVMRAGRRLLFVDGDVRREGEVVAVGQATFVPVAARASCGT